MHGSQSHSRGTTISVDPITRIEGHMRVEALVDDGVVKDAKCSGTLFRGFENILVGRYPVDAVRITQRVCGVCPTVHATASAFCLDEALGVADKIPDNGRIVRNLTLGSNYLQSHILHFFALAALDFVDVTAVADYEGSESELKAIRALIERKSLSPFFPRYEGDYRCDKATNVELVRGYLKALHVRRVCHEMLSIFGGKMPHHVDIVPGGVTSEVTHDRIATFASKLDEIRAFVDDVYLPAVLTVAKAYGDYFDIGAGCRRFLAYGAFNLDGASTDPLTRRRFLPSGVIETDGRVLPADKTKITEDVAHSRYTDECAAPPAEGKTIPQPEKEGAYTWLKAPRYDGRPAEVGPLARALVAYHAGHPAYKPAIDGVLKATGLRASKLVSVLGRHAARALESRMLCAAMSDWLTQLKCGEPTAVPLTIPQESAGAGLVDGPRGALGHWIHIKDKVISLYQLVVPTTWNSSPRDGNGVPGPMEQALIGTRVKDRDNPFEVLRVIRSFDPCLACSVHVMTAKGETRGVYRIV